MANFCISSGGNTGKPSCDLKDIVPIGVIPSPKKAIIPADTTDLKTFLQERFMENNKINRWYPMFDNLTITNNSEDAVIATLAGGYSEKLRNGNAIYQFDYPFALCKSKAINQFDGWTGGIFLVSKEGRIVGRKQSNGDLAALVPVSVYTSGGALGDGQNKNVTSLTVNFGDSGLLLNVIDVTDKIEDFDAEEMTGIIDLQLVPAGTSAGTVDVKIQTKCDGVNLFDVYGSKFEDAAVWKAVKKSDGTNVSVTSVTMQGDTQLYRLAFTAGAGEIRLSLADLNTLKTAGIEGYESNTIAVTIL